MADFIPVPNCIQVKVSFTDEGDMSALCIGYYGYTGGTPGASGLNDIASAFGGSIGGNLQELMTSDKTLTTIECRDLASDLGHEGIATPEAGGTRAGTKLAPGTAAVTSYTIGRHYRGGHPRNYWPFGAEADIGTFGLWSDAFVSELETKEGAFWAVVAATSFGSFTTPQKVNASRYKGYTNVAYGT